MVQKNYNATAINTIDIGNKVTKRSTARKKLKHFHNYNIATLIKNIYKQSYFTDLLRRSVTKTFETVQAAIPLHYTLVSHPVVATPA